jgi:hypothetical protein
VTTVTLHDLEDRYGRTLGAGRGEASGSGTQRSGFVVARRPE